MSHPNPFKTRSDRTNYPPEFAQAFDGHYDVALIPPSPGTTLTPPPMAAGAAATGVHTGYYSGGGSPRGHITTITGTNSTSNNHISSGSSSSTDNDEGNHGEDDDEFVGDDVHHHPSNNRSRSSNSNQRQHASSSLSPQQQEQQRETPPPSPIEKKEEWPSPHRTGNSHGSPNSRTPAATPSGGHHLQQQEQQQYLDGGISPSGHHTLGALSPVTAGESPLPPAPPAPHVDSRAAEARHLLLFSPRKQQQQQAERHQQQQQVPREPITSDSGLQQQHHHHHAQIVGAADERWEQERAKQLNDTQQRIQRKQRVQSVLKHLEAVLMREDGNGVEEELDGVVNALRGVWGQQSHGQQQPTSKPGGGSGGGSSGNAFIDRFNIERESAGDFCYYSPHLEDFSVSSSRFYRGAGYLPSTSSSFPATYAYAAGRHGGGSYNSNSNALATSFRAATAAVDASIRGLNDRRAGAFSGVFDVLSPQTNIAFSPVRQSSPAAAPSPRYFVGGSSDPQRIDSFFSRSNIGTSAYVFS